MLVHEAIDRRWVEQYWLDAQQGFSGALVVGRDLDRIGVGRRERVAHLTRTDG